MFAGVDTGTVKSYADEGSGECDYMLHISDSTYLELAVDSFRYSNSVDDAWWLGFKIKMPAASEAAENLCRAAREDGRALGITYTCTNMDGHPVVIQNEPLSGGSGFVFMNDAWWQLSLSGNGDYTNKQFRMMLSRAAEYLVDNLD